MIDTIPVNGRAIVASIKNPPNGTVESAPNPIVTAPPQAPPIAEEEEVEEELNLDDIEIF